MSSARAGRSGRNDEFDRLNQLYREVLLDHYRQPHRYGELDSPDLAPAGHNPVCGDQVTIELKLEGDKVVDVSFHGMGCAISVASSSMMMGFYYRRAWLDGAGACGRVTRDEFVSLESCWGSRYHSDYRSDGWEMSV